MTFCSTSRMVTPRLAQADHRVENLVDQHRREPHRRLVEQQEPRVAHQRAAHRQHLLLPAREIAGRQRAPLLQRREQIVDALQRVVILRMAAVGAELEIVLHRERREHLARLRHLGDAARDTRMRRQPVDILTVELDTAARLRLHARNHPHQRGLAGAVVADEGNDLALARPRGRHHAAPRCGHSG